MRVLNEIRKRHLAGANPVRPKPARQVGSEPCDEHVGEGAEAGRQRVWRCVGTRANGPCEVSPENWQLSRSRGCWRNPEGSKCPSCVMARRTATSTWSRCTARSKKMTQEPGRPASSVGRRRPRARETAAWAECEAGVGGPHTSDEAGERVTPDPVERRGSARVGTNFKGETWVMQ